MGPGTWLQLGLGLLLLFGGGEALVRGSATLAGRLGVTPLVVGVTVVAFGTSSPELLVSTTAAWRGQDALAVGNVVGSNIFNVLFILGACALLRPLVVAQQLVVRDVPIMIGVSFAFWLLALDGRVSVAEGALLFAGLVAFCLHSIRASRRETAEIRAEYDQGIPGAARGGLALDVALVLVGLGLLVVGARVLVGSAVVIAQGLGLDETVIALTIVSAGTGLPEVAASVVATLRGERDIAVGNVVGSCIFNVLGVLGVSALATGRGLAVTPGVESFDLPVMAAVAAACLPIMARGHRIPRFEGALFLAYYAAYVAYLVLAAKEHAALPRFSAVMLEFVVPLSIATLVALGFTARRAADTDVGR